MHLFTDRITRTARSRERTAGGGRAGRFLLISLGSGALAALIAILIAGVPTVIGFALASNEPSQIPASTLFPSPQPTHKTVTIYDPPTQQPAEPPSTEPREPASSPEPPEGTEPPEGSEPPGD